MTLGDLECGFLKRGSPSPNRECATECNATVTYVHGTRIGIFEAIVGGGGIWTDESAELPRALETAFHGHLVATRFEWSGKNSHQARLRAGAALAEHLKVLMARYPAAHHYVVAHSHGGNVAMYALREAGIRRKTAGLACIATPFLSVKRRAIEPTIRLLRTVVGVLFWYALWVALLYLALATADDRTGAVSWPALSVGIAMAIIARWVFTRVRKKLLRSASRRLISRQDHLLESLELPHAGSTPLLVVRAAGDEAATWLRIIDAVANLPYRLWSPQALFVVAVVLLFLTMPLSLMLGVLTIYPAIVEEPVARRSLEFTSMALILGTFSIAFTMVVLLLVTVLAQIILPVWAKLFRGHALGFGEGSPIENWLTHIAAVPSPPNADNVTTLAYATTGRGLSHSRLCTDPVSASAVTKWLAEKAQSAHLVSCTTERAGRGEVVLETPTAAERGEGYVERAVPWRARLVRSIGSVILCIPIVGLGVDITIAQIYPSPLPNFVLDARYWLSVSKLLPDADRFSPLYFAGLASEITLGLGLLALAARLGKSSPGAADGA